jgi:serine/threonine protein kinase
MGALTMSRTTVKEENMLFQSPLALIPGTILNDQYRVMSVAGQGGFGITYAGHDLKQSADVALKEFFPQSLVTRASNRQHVVACNEEARGYFEYGLARFIEEAQTLARFGDFPGIVTVRGFFHANQTGYLVMDYLDGVTFKEYLQRQGGKISFDLTCRILMPIMDALREVHRTGWLHRDISPDNIFITYSRQIKLLDFGAAKNAVGEQSQSLSVILKPGYAPIEQYSRRGRQGPWTDVYALGATFYRAITGQPPIESLDRLAGAPLPLPSQLGVRLPPSAEAALMKALAVKTEQRYQMVEEFQRSITQIVFDQVDPKPEPRPHPTPELKGNYAGLGLRLGAFAIDLFVVVLLSAFTGSSVIGYVLIAALIGFLYGTLMECSQSGATFGKQALGIAVTDLNGHRLSFGRAVLRNFIKIVSTIFFVLSFLLVLLPESRQSLHDQLAGCLVIKRDKKTDQAIN